MQTKSQEKFPDSEIEWAVDTSPEAGRGWMGAVEQLPGEERGMELRALAGQGPSAAAQTLGSSASGGATETTPGPVPSTAPSSGTRAQWEAASAWVSQHRCHHQPSAPGTLS